MYVSLCNHSVYSLLESCLQTSSLIQAAKSMEMPAVALTDTNSLFAAIKFYREAKKAGIKPIIGLSLNVKISTEPRPLIVLAKDSTGWENLKQLSSQSFFQNDPHKTFVDLDYLLEHHEGLFLLIGGLFTEIYHYLQGNQIKDAELLLQKLKQKFGDRLYLEITDHGTPKEQANKPKLLELSKKLQIPLVATNRVFYLKAEHAEYHDTLRCIAEGTTKNSITPSRPELSEFYFKSPTEMQQIFSDLPEALENTLKIANLCQLELTFPGPLLPEFQVPESFDQTKELENLEFLNRVANALEKNFTDEFLAKLDEEHKTKTTAEAADKVKKIFFNRMNQRATQYFVYLSNLGLKKRYATPSPEIQQRLDYELSVIILMDFVGYFLIVADFINWAKDHNIPVGPGRGSGAGSLVAYSLRITDIDPIKFNLLFERFLNPERVSMPDFDIDFCYVRRQEVIDYVTEKYGKENVAQIITFGTLKPKAVVKDVGRVLGLSFTERNNITKFINDKMLDPDNPKEFAPLAKMIHLIPELEVYYNKSGIYKELFDTASFLEGLPRHASTHAAGLVIGKTKIIDYVPLYKDPKTGATLTQYSMKYLEDCGLVKMDFLGLKTLTLIQNTLELLKSRGIILTEDQIPFDDPKTYELLSEGKSAMVFQFESAGMKKVLKKARPNSVEELTALNALYRPGPMDNISDFIQRKKGGKIEYPHKSLEPILKETYGIFVYQEQVMQAAQILAGYSLGAADLLRRAMGKKEKDAMAKQRPIFIENTKKLHGISEEKANEIFDLLEKFSSYGFNKSHSAAYAILAYKTAYLKANYPAEFLAANLTNELNQTKKLAEYIAEAKNLNLEIVPPHINLSDKHFTVVEGKIIYGLLAIKNLGEAAVDEILRARKQGGLFKDLEDFIFRTNYRVLSEKQLLTLIEAGAFDGLGHNRPTLKHYLPQVIMRTNKLKKENESGQGALFGNPGDDLPPIQWNELPDIDLKTKLKEEHDLLGFYASGHPLDEYRGRWEQYSNLNLKNVKSVNPQATFQILGILSDVRTFTTKNNEVMAVGKLEDFMGKIDVRVFPRVYKNCSEHFVDGNVVGLKGRVGFYQSEAQFTVEELVLVDSLKATTMAVYVEISGKTYRPSEITAIFDFFQAHRGNSPLFIEVNSFLSLYEPLVFKTGITVEDSDSFIEKIQKQAWCLKCWKQNPTFI